MMTMPNSVKNKRGALTKQGRSFLDIDGRSLKIRDLADFISDSKRMVKVAGSARKSIRSSFDFVTNGINGQIVYGVNTGFGPMASHIIGKKELANLQVNLVRSHAVGMGDSLPESFVLAAMIVRLNTLVIGYSGVSEELIDRLILFINNRILPIVPDHGAVGTSGDLTQLAHIGLSLIGEGEVIYRGERMSTRTALRRVGIAQSYKLRSREGLALINGTSMMSAIGAILCTSAIDLAENAVGLGAFGLELVSAFNDSYSEKLQSVRPHPGQKMVAKMLRDFLQNSKFVKTRKGLNKSVKITDYTREVPNGVQEVYSLRCLPQILGPILDTIIESSRVIGIEINSVTDNPIVDMSKKSFLHGGNFHGDYVSLAVDKLKIAITKLTMLSERQINFLLNDAINKKFPPFLNLGTLGLNLGLQGLQFVATSTTARNQTLCFPQYIHSIPTNKDNQDIVSMGTDAALIAKQIIDGAYVVLSIEAIVLAQAYDVLNRPEGLSRSSSEIFKRIRGIMKPIIKDRVLNTEVNSVLASLKASPFNKIQTIL